MTVAALLAVALTAAPVAAARPVVPGAAPLAGPAVVVLWASWCVSCRAEIARLPEMAPAAAPLPVRTLAIDPPERARALLTERGQPTVGAFADPRDPRTVLGDWGGTVLPLAVAIDARGQVCGRKIGLLGTDQLRDWAKRCSH